MPTTPKYRRVLLKVSGEALMGDGSLRHRHRHRRPHRRRREGGRTTPAPQICMVIGGGNIFRGLAGAAKGIDRATADYMGMLATVMNALAHAGGAGAGRACRAGSSRPSP